MRSDDDLALVENMQHGSLVFICTLSPTVKGAGGKLSTNNASRLNPLNRSTSTIAVSMGNKTRMNTVTEQVSEIVSFEFLTMEDKTGLSNLTKMLGDRCIFEKTDLPYSLLTENNFTNIPFATFVKAGADTDRKNNEKKMGEFYAKLMTGENLGCIAPDGIMINKYETESNPKYEEYLTGKQHAIYNVAVGGVSLCTSWSFISNHAYTKYGLSLPGDGLYILVVARLLEKQGDKYTAKTIDKFAQASHIGHVRFQRATERQLNYLTKHRKEKNANCIVKPNEIVLGGWYIAKVIDSAASSLNVNGMVVANQSTKAMMVNVNIRWVSAQWLTDRYA